jgi:hypothetical protein
MVRSDNIDTAHYREFILMTSPGRGCATSGCAALLVHSELRIHKQAPTNGFDPFMVSKFVSVTGKVEATNYQLHAAINRQNFSLIAAFKI